MPEAEKASFKPDLTVWSVQALTPRNSHVERQSARGVTVHMLLKGYYATTVAEDEADGFGKKPLPKIACSASLPNGKLNTVPVELEIGGETVTKPPGTVPLLAMTRVRAQVRSIMKAGTARGHTEGGVFYYYTPSAVEAGNVDTSKWKVGSASFSKTRRGHKKGHGQKRAAGESSAEEGEVSDSDSLASLNKKVKSASVGWGSGARA